LARSCRLVNRPRSSAASIPFNHHLVIPQGYVAWVWPHPCGISVRTRRNEARNTGKTIEGKQSPNRRAPNPEVAAHHGVPRLPSLHGSYKVAAYPAFHTVIFNLDPVSATVCDLEPSTFGRTAYESAAGGGTRPDVYARALHGDNLAVRVIGPNGSIICLTCRRWDSGIGE
jgi:hypothetical protein